MTERNRLIHTERGDVPISEAQMALYLALAKDRRRVHTHRELANELHTSESAVQATAASLHLRIAAHTGLKLLVNVWGVGYRLDP